MDRWNQSRDTNPAPRPETPRFAWIVWLAAVTAAGAAAWTVLSYKPPPEEIAAKRDESDGIARRVASATGGGERNIRRRLSNGDPQRALEDALIWAQTHKESVEAVYWASYLSSKHGDAGESRRLARRGLEMAQGEIERDPREPRWHALEGWFYLLQGDRGGSAEAHTKSRASFERAASLLDEQAGDMPDANVAYDLACYRAMAGNFDAAIEHLSFAVELGWTRTNWLLIDPDLDPVRGHVGYADVMVRLDEIRAIAEASNVDAPTFSDLRAIEQAEREAAAERAASEREPADSRANPPNGQ